MVSRKRDVELKIIGDLFFSARTLALGTSKRQFGQ
jgi:hypothetical protein